MWCEEMRQRICSGSDREPVADINDMTRSTDSSPGCELHMDGRQCVANHLGWFSSLQQFESQERPLRQRAEIYFSWTGHLGSGDACFRFGLFL